MIHTNGREQPPPKDEVLEIGGVRTHMQWAGEGHPLLFLDGGGGVEWGPALDALANKFRVYAPDHPGFGLSDRPDWLDTVDDLADFYLDLIEQLGLAHPHVVGVSLGGWIAAQLAVRGSPLLGRLVLADALGLKANGTCMPDIFAMDRAASVRLLYHDSALAGARTPVSPSVAVMVQDYKNKSTLAKLGWNPYLHDPKLARRLRRVSAPTLVLWGEHDSFTPQEVGKAYATGIRGARLATIPNSGHLPHIEQPDQFAARVLEFLES